MKSVTILGAGGHAKVVISLLKSNGYTIEKVLDDDILKDGELIMGYEIDVPIELHENEITCAHGIGSNKIRKLLAEKYAEVKWPVLIHPTAYVDPSAKVGNGSVIMAGAVIQADAQIGSHVIINTGATVDHDCIIGDYAHIAPGTNLAGENTIGEGVLMGVGSATIPQVKVGQWSVIGAGSVLGKSVPNRVLVAGNRAKIIKNI